ncbi:ABC-type amino acid transport/signal transduction systems, periplasmic component/domain protein [Shewanella piezotolerans WP3]|uniref:ABC-type amino acid transport/signal transduction systems, periplasmic component/domain protein n=1 Tax=Shewanella piezotolerans (strain WP3 / JCM 13877) TaxID=225849 RepID=B8CPL3_SHEPW|nr:transporter substrate-binding domain-containing protein [Shewanella piezotolerans]ACJ29589.1 ABC-type amino acid transport/signal transduction systems, periplasmic component/domain protein [Shewanella piezotolerans WP3]
MCSFVFNIIQRLTTAVSKGQKLFLFLILSCTLPVCYADTLYLTSLHWPPYAGSQLKNEGASIAITRAALAAVGHEVQVDFYPWSRAVRMASREDSKYSGYLPEYAYPTEKFVFSYSMGSSPLGLVEQKRHPISWSNQSDLNQYTIGVVQGYVNTEQLDNMIAQGVQPAEAVASDIHNIKKVVSGRIDAAVIDAHVLGYLLGQPDMKSVASRVQLNKRILTQKELYIAFKNNAEGKKWRDLFNQGLGKIDVDKILQENMAQ